MKLTKKTLLILALLSINTAHYSMANNPFKKIFNMVAKLFKPPKKNVVVIPVVFPVQQNSQQSTGNNSRNSMEAADRNNSLSDHRNSNLNKPIDMKEEEENNKAQLTKEEISKFINNIEDIKNTKTDKINISDPNFKEEIPASLLPNGGGEENEMK